MAAITFTLTPQEKQQLLAHQSPPRLTTYLQKAVVDSMKMIMELNQGRVEEFEKTKKLREGGIFSSHIYKKMLRRPGRVILLDSPIW